MAVICVEGGPSPQPSPEGEGADRWCSADLFLAFSPLSLRERARVRALLRLKIHQLDAAVLALNGFGDIRAIPGARPNSRVIAARVRALFINGAHARFAIQIQAIVIAHALQGENP